MGSKAHTEVIARGVLIEHGRVLLCRNIKGGYCYLPGGHIEFGERAREALIRELKEETGLDAGAGPLLLASEHCFQDSDRIHHELDVVFLVEHLGTKGEPTPDPVTSLEKKIDFVWVDLAQLIETDLRPIEIKAWLMSGGGEASGVERWISGFSATP